MAPSNGGASDPTKHWMVGKKVDGGVVVSVSESKKDFGPRHYRIKREVVLSTGAKYWKESVLLKEKSDANDQEAEFDKQATEEASRKKDVQAKARKLAQERMKANSKIKLEQSQQEQQLEQKLQRKEESEKKEVEGAKRKGILSDRLSKFMSPSPGKDTALKKGASLKGEAIAPPLSTSPAAKKKATVEGGTESPSGDKAPTGHPSKRHSTGESLQPIKSETISPFPKKKEATAISPKKSPKSKRKKNVNSSSKSPRRKSKKHLDPPATSSSHDSDDEGIGSLPTKPASTSLLVKKTKKPKKSQLGGSTHSALSNDGSEHNRPMSLKLKSSKKKAKKKKRDSLRTEDSVEVNQSDLEKSPSSTKDKKLKKVKKLKQNKELADSHTSLASEDMPAKAQSSQISLGSQGSVGGDGKKPSSKRRRKKKNTAGETIDGSVHSVDTHGSAEHDMGKQSPSTSPSKKKKDPKKKARKRSSKGSVEVQSELLEHSETPVEAEAASLDAPEQSIPVAKRFPSDEFSLNSKEVSENGHVERPPSIEESESKKPEVVKDVETSAPLVESTKATLDTQITKEVKEVVKPKAHKKVAAVAEKDVLASKPKKDDSSAGDTSDDNSPAKTNSFEVPLCDVEVSPPKKKAAASEGKSGAVDLKQMKADYNPDVWPKNEKTEEIKKSSPAFSKIMGVWEARQDKLAYSAPLEPVRTKSDKNKKAPTWQALMNRFDTSTAPEPAQTNEKAPGKLRNVFAEKIGEEERRNFKAPVHQKSKEEELFISETVGKNFVFDDLAPTNIKPLLDAFEKKEFKEGVTIADEGDAECYYSIVQTGEVVFHSEGKQVGAAGPGQAFGELALLYSCPTPAAATTADNETVLFQIHQTDFRHIMREQMIRSEEEKFSLLQTVPLFKDLGEGDLRQLGEAMIPHHFKEGDNLSATFQEAPFCLVQQGTVVATDVRIGPGGTFGEENVTDDAASGPPPKFDVKATSDGVAFTIDRPSFEKVFGDFSRLSQKYRDKQALTKLRPIRLAKLTEPQIDTLVRQIVETKFEAGHEMYKVNDKIPPAMYFVRKGKVKIVKKNGEEKFVLPGEFFGQEYLMFTSKGSRETIPDFVIAKNAATAMEDTECGMVTLQEVANVSGRTAKTDLESTQLIPLENLEHHRVLGEGQFGTVWLVTDVTARKREGYALKIQYTSDKSREDSAACIRREIQMMRALQYSFVVQLINTYENEAEASISMLLSLAPGGELWDIIHREVRPGEWVSGIDEKTAKFYAAIVADTLAYMHRQKFVYRDLKPENVLIDKDGYPVLTDFGFVKRLEDKGRGMTYTFCGTPNYIAPEIVVQRGHGTAADNWSLGVLIYELVDGQNPFWTEGMDQATLYELICQALFYPLSESRTTRHVRELVNRLLERDPMKRLGSFREKDILEHKWFRGIDLAAIRDRKVKAPWIPKPIAFKK